MLGFVTLALAGAGMVSARRLPHVAPRQFNNDTALSSSLPSYQAYINATRNDNSPVVLHIDTQDTSKRNATSPYLYGIMHEDINHSGDGGIYAEMIANRAFQGSNSIISTLDGYVGTYVTDSENDVVPFDPVMTAWAPIGHGVRMTLDILHPLSDALETSLQIDFPLNATGEVGFQNFGWWGFDIHPQQYNTSLWYLNNYPRNTQGNASDITVSFRSNVTGETWASSTFKNVTPTYIDFKQLETTLHPNATAPDANNTFAITFDGAQVAGQTFYFNLVSVFPETFKGYQNGLRPDIAQGFYDLNPTFLRFPGGNNLEGYSPAQRWKWWETLGPLQNRPGRVGDWNYYNTQGLGLLEYLEWTEAMNIEPVLAVYAGFSLDVYGQNGASYPPEQMPEILQEALDELEYCMGDNSTKWGAQRIADGHPEPFKINFVEIGNEDWFSVTYPYRFQIMYDGLKKAYPNITYISTAFNENAANYNISIPDGNMWDWHGYQEPSWFLANFDLWDNWQEETNNTGVTVLLGEYSVIQIDTPSGIVNYSYPLDVHVQYPRLLSAIAEGVYALGAERNPNTVRMSSYAPSLQNRNFTNWTPDMISYDALHDNTVLSASYWQQWLFAHYRGTETLPVTATEGEINPLYWAASIDEEKNAIYLKVINTLNSTVPLSVNIPSAYSGVNGTSITASDLNSYNYVGNKTEVVPRPAEVESTASSANGSAWSWDVPKFSITVLQFDLC
ncbi:glycoside hydrolase [Aureobasidium pullulans]|nr:glycoside hydrolase [Aureobasidium pullulans]THW05913.1 glycoside hydrolase [Aureobasidium pullulans]THW18638.1 glycoside hydrolase [Aureobasidium pullulans]THW27907.1 glycoside hydrolase [Aureobasidium pullulans]THW78902.1 glycoside hydrolase [Aureobasidium pullulans]